jgi:NAD(P)-dependent dehydrogenase (short-subunit alcohol dehydrogenase family)
MSDNQRSVVVTGATSGIGLAVYRLLLANNFRVLAVGRTRENCERTKCELRRAYPDAGLEFFCADLAQQREVLRVAAEIERYLEENCGGGLWGLVNNAGCVRSWYMTSDEGYEQQFAVNHLAGFLLSHELLSYLKKNGGRIIFIASPSHKMMKMHWDDLMFQKRYHPFLAYKQSKLCNMLNAYALNEDFRQDGVIAYAIDPGLVKTAIGNKKTGWLVDFAWRLRRRGGQDAAIPAQTYLYLLSAEPAPAALYYYDCRPRRYSKEVNSQNAKRLTAISCNLCQISRGDGSL